MEGSGYAPRWDRGDPGTREFIAFYVSDDKVVGALNANVWDVTGPLQALIAEGRPIDDARLEDRGVPLAIPEERQTRKRRRIGCSRTIKASWSAGSGLRRQCSLPERSREESSRHRMST
jgi:hypothetical protein